MPADQNTGTTLLHLRYELDLDEEAFSALEDGTIVGVSLKADRRPLCGGRESVVLSFARRTAIRRSENRPALLRWKTMYTRSLRRTKQDLVLMRTSDMTKRSVTSEHLFDEERASKALVPIENHLRRLFVNLHHDSDTPLRVLDGPTISEDETLRLRNLGAAIEARMLELRKSVDDLIGPMPTTAERFPLWASISEELQPIGGQSAMYLPWLDATSTKEVAQNLFGIRNYRRPLAAEVGRIGPGPVLSWFRLFRGLVPIEQVIDAMRGSESIPWGTYHQPTAHELATIRQILRRLPVPVLRRILQEQPLPAYLILRDAAHTASNPQAMKRDLDLLPEVIAIGGQRRLRSSRDVEQLVRGLPEQEVFHDPKVAVSTRIRRRLWEEGRERRALENHNHLVRERDGAEEVTWEQWRDPAFREELEAARLALEEQAERERIERRRQAEREKAEWTNALSDRLDGAQLPGGYRIVVAKDQLTLLKWSQRMRNCIDSYADVLGIEVLAAVLDSEGEVRLNLQITHENGLMQMQGYDNTDATRAIGETDAQAVLDHLVECGVTVWPHAIGTHGLTVRELAGIPA